MEDKKTNPCGQAPGENGTNVQKAEDFYSRTRMVLGDEAVQKLKKARVIIFGVGGVGGYALEAMVRAGVGKITAVDSDTVAPSNLNRQVIATTDAIGRKKVDVAKERALSINPCIDFEAICCFYSDETKGEFDLSKYDYVIDAIDYVPGKIALVEAAKSSGTPIISAMGAGNKLDPTRFKVADISKTYSDPLARAVRTRLKKLGITSLKVVFSDEEPTLSAGERVPGSLSFVPSVAGLIIGGEVIKDIANK